MEERNVAMEGMPVLIDWVARWNVASAAVALAVAALALLELVGLAN